MQEMKEKMATPQNKKEEGMIHVDSSNFDQVITENEWTIVDCWAPWCMPCKMMEPAFEKLSIEFKNKVKFVKLNTDHNQDIAMRFQIMGIPSFLLFNKGKLVQKVVGAVGEPGLRALLAKAQ